MYCTHPVPYPVNIYRLRDPRQYHERRSLQRSNRSPGCVPHPESHHCLTGRTGMRDGSWRDAPPSETITSRWPNPFRIVMV